MSTQGKTIGAHDLVVAATTLAGGANVATLNQKEFKRVPGLSLDAVATFTKK